MNDRRERRFPGWLILLPIVLLVADIAYVIVLGPKL